MPMTVIGFRKTSFKTKETNETISGYNLYVSEPIDPKYGEGETADRLFMTSDKLIQCGYNPAVGYNVKVEYNRYGKPAAIYPI